MFLNTNFPNLMIGDNHHNNFNDLKKLNNGITDDGSIPLQIFKRNIWFLI